VDLAAYPLWLQKVEDALGDTQSVRIEKPLSVTSRAKKVRVVQLVDRRKREAEVVAACDDKTLELRVLWQKKRQRSEKVKRHWQILVRSCDRSAIETSRNESKRPASHKPREESAEKLRRDSDIRFRRLLRWPYVSSWCSW
jgi:hypothetical protein